MGFSRIKNILWGTLLAVIGIWGFVTEIGRMVSTGFLIAIGIYYIFRDWFMT